MNFAITVWAGRVIPPFVCKSLRFMDFWDMLFRTRSFSAALPLTSRELPGPVVLSLKDLTPAVSPPPHPQVPALNARPVGFQSPFISSAWPWCQARLGVCAFSEGIYPTYRFYNHFYAPVFFGGWEILADFMLPHDLRASHPPPAPVLTGWECRNREHGSPRVAALCTGHTVSLPTPTSPRALRLCPGAVLWGPPLLRAARLHLSAKGPAGVREGLPLNRNPSSCPQTPRVCTHGGPHHVPFQPLRRHRHGPTTEPRL